MNSQDMDRLLEQSLSGDPPGQAFRARVLLDSTEALVRARQVRARWRFAVLSAAAVFVATVSFLLGRCSMSSREAQPAAKPIIADATGTVPVPGELVTWLQAARFFRQLGMEERVALAYERAGNLVPYDSANASDPAGRALVADGEARRREPADMKMSSGEIPSAERIRSIIAQCFGG
jgi:hypothetical protein